MRHMTQIVEHHQLAAGDIALEPSARLRWDQLDAPAPENRCRHFHRRNLRADFVLQNLLRAFHQGAAITFAQGQFVMAIWISGMARAGSAYTLRTLPGGVA